MINICKRMSVKKNKEIFLGKGILGLVNGLVWFSYFGAYLLHKKRGLMTRKGLFKPLLSIDYLFLSFPR